MGGAGPGEASLEGGRLDQAPQQRGEAVAVLAVAPAEEALAVAPQGSEPAGAWVGTFPRRPVTSLVRHRARHLKKYRPSAGGLVRANRPP